MNAVKNVGLVLDSVLNKSVALSVLVINF